MAMFLNPATFYVGTAGFMFLSYASIEAYAGALSNSGTKFVMSSWCSISLIVASFIMAIDASRKVGTADPNSIGMAFLLCILTLCISSSVINSARS
jgi:hypothetical protein